MEEAGGVVLWKITDESALLEEAALQLANGRRYPVKQHLDVFNYIIMDLGNIDIKVKSEDQALIVLSSLPASYESFVDTLLYGKDTISLDDINNALKSNELKKSYPDGRDVSETHGLAAWGG